MAAISRCITCLVEAKKPARVLEEPLALNVGREWQRSQLLYGTFDGHHREARAKYDAVLQDRRAVAQEAFVARIRGCQVLGSYGHQAYPEARMAPRYRDEFLYPWPPRGRSANPELREPHQHFVQQFGAPVPH